jgi:hypothetical protein
MIAAPNPTREMARSAHIATSTFTRASFVAALLAYRMTATFAEWLQSARCGTSVPSALDLLHAWVVSPD